MRVHERSFQQLLAFAISDPPASLPQTISCSVHGLSCSISRFMARPGSLLDGNCAGAGFGGIHVAVPAANLITFEEQDRNNQFSYRSQRTGQEGGVEAAPCKFQYR